MFNISNRHGRVLSAYLGVGDVTDCDNLQHDLNAVYDWASSNNMFLTPKSLVMSVVRLANPIRMARYCITPWRWPSGERGAAYTIDVKIANQHNY